MRKIPEANGTSPAQSEDTCNGKVHSKAAYHAPELATFGHVAMLTQGVGSFSGDGGTMRMMAAMTMMTMTMTMSDERTKQDIVSVGQHPLGFGLYCYKYKPAFRHRHGAGRQFGVLAQEVEKVVPAAVLRGSDGYRRVNYQLLGIRLAASIGDPSQGV